MGEKAKAHWLEGSKEDLQLAYDLHQLKRYVYSLFFAHLALEKALKALVISVTGEDPPYTHNLLMLAKKANLDLEKEQISFLTEVNRYQIETRYPDIKRAIYDIATAELTGQTLKKIEETILWINAKMK